MLLGAASARGQEQRRPVAVVLVATADLTDGNFGRSVVLVTRTPLGEVVGVILNRPTDQAWPDSLRGGAPAEARIHFGGPLATDTLFAVAAAAAAAPEGTLDLGQGLRFAAGLKNVLALRRSQADAGAGLKLLRGYAGWGPGQLEGEIAAGAWTVQAATAALIFDPDPATQWQRLRALRRATQAAPVPPPVLRAGLGLDKIHPVDRLHADVPDLRTLLHLERHRGAALADRPEFPVKRFQ